MLVVLRYDDPLPHRPARVLVAGVSGVGKTTLARRIATVIGAPHTEIDGLYHGPKWTPRDEFLADVHDLVAADTWTTEWQYRVAKSLLAERADTLVWLDLPFATVTLPRVVRRTVRRRVRREVLWNGNTEHPLRTFFTDGEHILRWSVRTRHKLREQVPALETEWPHLVVVRLARRRQVERWLDGELRRACERQAGG